MTPQARDAASATVEAAVDPGAAQQISATVAGLPRGLSAVEAAQRLSHDGRNELPPPRRPSLMLRFARQFTDLFAVMLLVAAGITVLAYLLSTPRPAGDLELAIAILAVVLINAGIGFGQEYAAERTAEALRAMVPHTTQVVRDGERVQVPASDLVVGDLVVLAAGDAVPADALVVESHELSVNNMALTGESEPKRRTVEPGAMTTAPLESRTMVWMGTVVAAGSGKALVTATGTATEFGRIYRLTAHTVHEQSPLQRQLALMARRVAAAAFVLGALVFAVRLPLGGRVVDTFVFALGVMVALVPEGLPATMSVALAIGVRRMARRHALIKKLVAVETLGSTTMICTDKTGTLTKAEMTVQQLWEHGDRHLVTGVGYGPDRGEVDNPGPVRELLRVAALCCDARLLPPDDRDGWRVLGDTTEGALLVAAAKAGLDIAAEQATAPRVAELPFDSVRKRMTTVHVRAGRLEACVKGAPSELLNRCTHIAGVEGVRELDGETRARVVTANDAMAGSALRVLGVAVRDLGPAGSVGAVVPQRSPDDVESRLTLLGLVGMLDPPRPEVVAAVRACHDAGIRIVMITGDYALTAEAIARRVGIITGHTPQTVTGAQLDESSDEDLRAIVAQPDEMLFARAKPEHKMRIVAALQERGEVVAVTGDGANDAPALKRADIGVAMGESGTDVAREAAEMVLLDDSFASIAAAVELGRSVYQNIRKFLIYLFSHNIGELVPILAATAVGFPLVPLSAVQVLAIDLGSDVLPALALGAEPPEPTTMSRPPRDPRQNLFSAALVRRFLFLGSIQAVGVTAIFFWHIHTAGIPFDAFTADNRVYREALTMTQAGIVVCQFFNGFTVRSDRESIFRLGLLSNRPLVLAEFAGIAMMCAISYAPPLQVVFNTAPLSLADWALLVVLGLLLLTADETRKAILRHRDRSGSTP